MMERIDILLVKKKIFNSRVKAKEAIKQGIVYIDELKIDKPSFKVNEECEIKISKNIFPYASRAGLKLEKALQSFNIDLKNQVVLDIGASTGGFTDCALQYGAKAVYALDVGENQLVEKLRNDSKVIVIENTNFRYANKDLFDHYPIDFVTIDVSFISLKHIFPNLVKIISQDTFVICLIKPQFEAGKENIGKRGIVKDKDIHQAVIENVVKLGQSYRLELLNLDYSPIIGGDGNIEFIALFRFVKEVKGLNINDIDKVVEAAHIEFSKKSG